MKTVESLSVDDILDKASSGYFQIPQFQREFVWNNKQICSLIESALKGLPCGAIVTWENPNGLRKKDYHDIRLEEKNSGKMSYINFPPKNTKHNEPRIVIDGQQRITAISVAFGGLRNKNAKYRLGGKFYINLDSPDIEGSIRFRNWKRITKENLDDPETWQSTGIFPLNNCPRPAKAQLSASQASYWAGEVFPAVISNKKRAKRVTEIIKRIGQPIMAELPLEKTQSLSDIAEIFELLNTQGTIVSMVDILHSTLYEWFLANKSKRFYLRDWIDDIYNDNSTSGWGRDSKRQIILQLGVATELSASARKAPRNIKTKPPENINNKDILNLNESHWAELDTNIKLFKSCIHEFQK